MSDNVPSNWPADWTPPRVTTGDMLTALRAEASRTVVSQMELIRGGVLPAPSELMLRRAIAFHRASEFLNRVLPYIEEINELVARLQRRGPR